MALKVLLLIVLYAKFHYLNLISGTILAIYGSGREPLHCSEAYCHFKYPVKFLEELAMEGSVFWVDVLALVTMFVTLRILGYFVLKFKLIHDR